jgi:hypothetical protein
MIQYSNDAIAEDKAYKEDCERCRREREIREAFPVTEWQDDVARGDTRLGYDDWVKHNMESMETETDWVAEEPPYTKTKKCEVCGKVGAISVSGHPEHFDGDYCKEHNPYNQ